MGISTYHCIRGDRPSVRFLKELKRKFTNCSPHFHPAPLSPHCQRLFSLLYLIFLLLPLWWQRYFWRLILGSECNIEFHGIDSFVSMQCIVCSPFELKRWQFNCPVPLGWPGLYTRRLWIRYFLYYYICLVYYMLTFELVMSHCHTTFYKTPLVWWVSFGFLLHLVIIIICCCLHSLESV